MTKIIHKEPLNLTTSSGTASGNTNRLLVGLLRQILASPATSTTVYDIKIVSPEGLTIFEALSCTGDYGVEVVLPIRGIYTVTISNATVDELFTIGLNVDE